MKRIRRIAAVGFRRKVCTNHLNLFSRNHYYCYSMSGETRRVLDELIGKCHSEHQVLFHNLTFHKHDSHHLGSLFFLGADSDLLQTQYETSIKNDSEPEQESPHKITMENWKDSIGNKKFCKSYRQFFDDQLQINNPKFDWKSKIMEFLTTEVTPGAPLMNGLVSGLAHPLISLGYAFELNSAIVGSEALTLVCATYSYLHKLFDNLSIPTGSKTPFEILSDIQNLKEFNHITSPGADHMQDMVESHQSTLLNCFKDFNYAQYGTNMEYLFDFTTYLFAASHKPTEVPRFDFFLLHCLTALNAIRSLIKFSPTPKYISEILPYLINSWFLFVLVVYVDQMRPIVIKGNIDDYKLAPGKDWSYVTEKALKTKLVEDVHILKVVRLWMDARSEFGEKGEMYLKCAVKFVDNVDVDRPYIGFKESESELNVVNYKKPYRVENNKK